MRLFPTTVKEKECSIDVIVTGPYVAEPETNSPRCRSSYDPFVIDAKNVLVHSTEVQLHSMNLEYIMTARIADVESTAWVTESHSDIVRAGA